MEENSTVVHIASGADSLLNLAKDVAHNVYEPHTLADMEGL